MQNDRRRIPRVPVFFLLERMKVMDGEGNPIECQGVVRNITPDGLLLESGTLLRKQDLLQLRFTLPNTHKTLQVEGKVRWQENKKASSLAGIEFMDLSSESRDQIMDYLLTLGPQL